MSSPYHKVSAFFLILGRLCAVSILPHFKATLNSFNFDLVSRGMSTSLVEKLKTEFVHHCTMFSKSDLKLVLIFDLLLHSMANSTL